MYRQIPLYKCAQGGSKFVCASGQPLTPRADQPACVFFLTFSLIEFPTYCVSTVEAWATWDRTSVVENTPLILSGPGLFFIKVTKSNDALMAVGPHPFPAYNPNSAHGNPF